MAKGGISGVAVGMVSTGAYLVYAGINDVPLLDGLRSLVRGDAPKGKEKKDAAGWLSNLPSLTGGGNPATSVIDGSAGTSASGNALVAAARKYLGVPYRWGGTTRAGLDCSGLVQLSFRDIGITDCPRTSLAISRWSKLRKVSAPAAGDILWWSGHVAIATSPTRMIEAPTFGIPVRETGIRRGALVLRYVSSAPTGGGPGRRAI
jgi:cell wall-associated NlpC family hydrolase